MRVSFFKLTLNSVLSLGEAIEGLDREKCFVCSKKGHWDNKFPNKKKNPRLAAMFSEDLDPAWWDLAWCAIGDYDESEIIFLQ